MRRPAFSYYEVDSRSEQKMANHRRRKVVDRKRGGTEERSSTYPPTHLPAYLPTNQPRVYDPQTLSLGNMVCPAEW